MCVCVAPHFSIKNDKRKAICWYGKSSSFVHHHNQNSEAAHSPGRLTSFLGNLSRMADWMLTTLVVCIRLFPVWDSPFCNSHDYSLVTTHDENDTICVFTRRTIWYILLKWRRHTQRRTERMRRRRRSLNYRIVALSLSMCVKVQYTWAMLSLVIWFPLLCWAETVLPWIFVRNLQASLKQYFNY